MTEPRPDPPEDRDPGRGATRPGASPGTSGPGTLGYDGEDAGAADLVPEAVDDMDRRQGLDDPGRVADAASADDDDPGADRVANPAAAEGEAPTG